MGCEEICQSFGSYDRMFGCGDVDCIHVIDAIGWEWRNIGEVGTIRYIAILKLGA